MCPSNKTKQTHYALHFTSWYPRTCTPPISYLTLLPLKDKERIHADTCKKKPECEQRERLCTKT